MKQLNNNLGGASARPSAKFFAGIALLAMGAATASAQTTTTSTLWVGTGVTNPGSGVILSGTAINPATGNPFRHLWYGDHLQGICRVDPDIDTAGPHNINLKTCVLFVFGNALKADQLAFDPRPSTIVAGTFDLYAVGLQAKNQGVFRLHYIPGGDTGHGALDVIHTEALGGANGCGLNGNFPDSIAFGPDGNLYVGFKRSGNLIRFIAPGTEPYPCGNAVTMGTTGDQRKDFGLGWIGHDLYGADGFSPWVIPNADTCLTPLNGNIQCHGASLLAGQVAVPSAMISDQSFPALDGTKLYFGNPNQVSMVQVKPSIVVTANYSSPYSFVTSLTVDKAANGAQTLYVGDDPSAGFGVGQGRIFQVTPTAGVLAAPGAPFNVTAVAGNASATVTFTPAADLQPVTSFTIITVTPTGGATTVPNVVLTAPTAGALPPTTGTVTGLTNGVPVAFVVTATNAAGTSPLSAISNVVTPQLPGAPSAPTNVTAVAGSASATVTWTPAAANGSTITGYVVTSRINGAAINTTVVGATATGATITGLTNGTTYTFTVHATSNIGNGAESLPSNPVTPGAGGIVDMGVTMAGPASVNFGANGTYNLTVTNHGTVTVPQVVVTDNFAPAGVTFVSATASQGACNQLGTAITCNLGGMAPGASASITVILQISATSTNSATVAANDASGLPLVDAFAGNNTASVTTSIATGVAATTDLQISGSAQNGGPAVGTTDTYTWQIKNAQSQTASGVVFTDVLPPTLGFVSVSTNMGACTAPASGTLGGTVSCTAPSLANGPTMIVTINVTVPVAGTIANSGTVSFAGTDTNPANNSFTVTIQAK